MANYLLSTWALMDLISRKSDLPVFQWIDSQQTASTQIYISVVSIGLAQAAIESHDNPILQRQFRESLQDVMESWPPENIVEFTLDVVAPWSLLVANGDRLQTRKRLSDSAATVSLGQSDRMVVATALQRDLVLVEPAQPYHKQLAPIGLRVETADARSKH